MKKRFEIIAKYFLSILTCFVIVSIFFALYGLFQVSILDKGYASYFGYSLFEVESGSMSPTINVKDMVIVKKTNKVKKDDIITYELEGNFITHRVVEVQKKKVVAKGDYNNYEDKTIPRDCIIGKVVLRIPKFGVWKEIVLSPIVLITIFFTMLLFGLGFSYEDKKLAAKKRVGYTFKDEVFEEDESSNEVVKKIKKYLERITNKLSKKNVNNEIDNPFLENDSIDDEPVEQETESVLETEDVIENTLNGIEKEQISITVKCKWIDDNNRDGLRPKSVVVKLMKNNEILQTQEIDDTNWEYTFDNLDKYENESDNEIKYIIDSNMVSGYRKDISGYDIVNIHNPKKININGEISWVDDNNKNNTRPKSVDVKLMNNKEFVSSKKVSKDNKWKYTFIDLYKYENGEEIKYMINEEEVKGYNKYISGYDITNTSIRSNK